MSFTLRDLIYSKQIKDGELHQRLLTISMSSMWVEDLIDLIVEMSEDDICKIDMDCEKCEIELDHDERCHYRKLKDIYDELEKTANTCPGTWDCENCEEMNVGTDDNEICDYHKLKEKYQELKDESLSL